MRTLSFLTLLLLSPAALAQTITFESIPGVAGVAPEGLAIQDQFDVSPYWVRFERLEGGRSLPATLARVGAPRTAFVGQTNTRCDGLRSDADKPNTSTTFDAGCYFLTDDGLVGTSSPQIQPLVIRYTVPVLQASGTIFDVDNSERFSIHARDRNEVDITAPVLLTPGGGSGGNGDASFWAFDVDEPIHSILIEFTGSGGSKGIAFDQFSTASICPSEVIHRGNGTPGSGGHVPALSITCPRIGQPGSIEVFNGLGGAQGCLAISLSPMTQPLRCGSTPLPFEYLSSTVYAFSNGLSGPAGAPGMGRFTKSYDSAAIPLSMLGATIYLQAGYIDPGAACGIALTEIVEATIL